MGDSDEEEGGKWWVDIAARSGIDIEHYAGADGRFFLPETMSGGGGFLDYDGDGHLDCLVIQGCSWPPKADDPTMKLFRGRGDGIFEDRTQQAGLDVVLRGMGTCCADYDNDGDTDIFVTGVGRSLFFVNDGKGHFEERGQELGLELEGWSAPAAFFDYDRDGDLDLLVGGYVQWDPLTEERGHCFYGKGTRDYCPVGIFPSETMRLFRQEEGGTFKDVSAESGMADLEAKALGIALIDLDEDGWLDVLVANDTVPYLTFRNNRNGTFTDMAIESGMALSESGSTYAGMGIDVSFDAGRSLAVSVGNFSGEPVTFRKQLWNPELGVAENYFVEEAFSMGLARRTLASVTFGLFFLDVECDGDEDLLVANGHVGRTQELEGIPYPQATQLFLREGDRFTLSEGEGYRDLCAPIVGRGAAYGDIDHDGDLDVVLFDNRGAVKLLENRTPRKGHWLRIKTQGTQSNRDGIGASVRVVSGDKAWRDRVGSASSYLSQHELTLTFGVGDLESVDQVIVDWPLGGRDVLVNVSTDQEIVVREGEHPVDVEHGPESDLDERSAAFLRKSEGMKALENGLFSEAIEKLAGAVEAAPGDHVARLSLIRAHLGGADREKAIEEVRELIAFYGDAKQAILGPATSALNAGDPEVELLVLEVALEEMGQQSWLHNRMANALYKKEFFHRALSEFEKAQSLEPSNHMATLGMAMSLWSLQRLDEAAVVAETLVEKAPELAEGHKALGLVYRDQGLIGIAAKALEKSCELAPGVDDARQNLIAIYESQGKLAKVKEHAEMFLAKRPNHPKAWEAVVTIRARSGQAQQALSLSREALEKFPDNPDILYVAARAELQFARQPKTAKSLIEKATTLDPDHRRSWELMATICRGLGDREGAIKALEEVLRISPNPAIEKALETLRAG